MKKWLALLFVSLLAIGYSIPASAQDSSSYETKSPTSGYNGGFFVGSDDGEYKMKFGARVDPMFYWQSSKVPDDPGTEALNESLDQATFRLRRAQIWLNPSFKNFSVFVLVGHGTSGNRNGGTQSTYWSGGGTLQFNDHVSLEAGYVDPPFDYMNTVSSKRMTMVDPPITVTQQDGEQTVWNISDDRTIMRPSFGLPTQTGLILWTNWINNTLQASVAVGNGTESTDQIARNRQLTYTGRISYNIMGEDVYTSDMSDFGYTEVPSFGMGLGGAFEHDDGYAANSGGTTVKMYNWAVDGSVDAIFRYKGFALNMVGYGRKLRVGPGAVFEANEKYLDDFGYLTTVSMFVIPKRAEVQGWAAQIIREGPDNDAYEFGGGFNYYIKGHNVQLMTDFSHVMDYDDVIGTNHGTTNRVRMRLQMYF